MKNWNWKLAVLQLTPDSNWWCKIVLSVTEQKCSRLASFRAGIEPEPMQRAFLCPRCCCDHCPSPVLISALQTPTLFSWSWGVSSIKEFSLGAAVCTCYYGGDLPWSPQPWQVLSQKFTVARRKMVPDVAMLRGCLHMLAPQIHSGSKCPPLHPWISLKPPSLPWLASQVPSEPVQCRCTALLFKM